MELLQKRESPKTKLFKLRLIRWYGRHRRTLPWRDHPTPYRVWISEIMLQQTQVNTVIPYYERFLERFPDMESLARAQEEDVVKLWAGLGYYTRARNLHKAARVIMKGNGQFPQKYSEILQLPGIGRYTAGAISSIAFNEAQPVVDGNIKRVITRLQAIRTHTPDSRFWNQMSDWVRNTEPSSFNQAMMELGATVCLPVQPRCARCPVAQLCAARRLGIQNKIPRADAKQPVESIDLVILVLEWKTKMLLSSGNRPSFIPGKWCLPCRRILKDESPEQAAAKMSRSILGETMSLGPMARISHSITRYRIKAFGFYGKLDRFNEIPALRPFCWTGAQKSRELLTSSLFRKILEKLPARPPGRLIRETVRVPGAIRGD